MARWRIDKRLYFMMAIILVALIAVFVAATCCIINMRYAINKQVYSNLEDVADQTDSAIEKRVELYYDLMVNLRTELEKMEEAGGDPTEDITKLHTYAEMNGLVRVAFCDKNGYAYGSDQDVTDSKGKDLSNREFYTRGMEGKCTITEQLDDRMGTEEDINIMTAPWYAADGSIRGVFGITFYSEKISELLSVDAFDGDGGSFAVNESGLIVVDSSGGTTSHVNEQLVDVLRTNEENMESLSSIEEQLRSGSESRGTVYIDGDQKLYYQKILSFEKLNGDVQWRIFTIVSQSYVRTRFFAVNFDFYTLVGIFMLIFIISVAALLILAQRHRRTVEKVAYVDAVTGGDNYPMYRRRLRRNKPKFGAFISMDMVEFNSVRIAVGTAEGQKILREVNIAIKSMLADDELVAHVDMDIFALFLSVTDPEEVKERMQRISDRLLELSGELGVPHLRTRYGAYIEEDINVENLEICFNRAGQAREMARKKNRSCWLYAESDNEQELYERNLTGNFSAAIENEEFEVWYQPKYNAQTGKIVGAEALVRWRKDGELIPPGKFIPLFEDNGMIARLDEYMFRKVCCRQQQRVAAGKRVEPVSVNLSRATMYNENITDKYMGILNLYGADVKDVQIEITESAVVGKDNLTLLLHKFKNMGEHILLDDFGTGYSSMSILSSKCFDTLKIDKSLVDNIESDSGITLVSSIVQMAHKLNMSVTAEGVESEAQYECLRTLSCDAIQGFYFSRPLPMEEYEALLDAGC